jgi:hypothetical protein
MSPYMMLISQITTSWHLWDSLYLPLWKEGNLGLWKF